MTAPAPTLMRGAGMTSPSSLRELLLIAGLAIAYWLTARFLTNLAAPPNGAVLTVWLPAGLSVAALFLFGPRMALGSFAGSVAFEISLGTPWPAVLAVGIANSGSELLCYHLISGRTGRRFSIDTVPDVARVGTAAALAGLGSACLGVTAYVVFGVIPADHYFPSWMTWFGSIVIGVLLITPFLVNAAQATLEKPPRSRPVEFTCAVVMLTVAAYYWQGPTLSRDIDEPVLFVIILALLWLAFRFTSHVMTLAVFAFAVAAVCSAVLRLSQMHPDAAYISIFSLQMMLGGLALLGYVLAAMVTQQRRDRAALQTAQGEAIANARQAGMAEIATNVLHNVGNVLNSVNVSASLVVGRLQDSRTRGLSNAVRLMEENADRLGEFLTSDDRGKLLPAYLGRVSESLAEEQRGVIEELGHLTRNIDHIKEIVATQQSYAGVSTVLELARPADLVEDAVRINGHAAAHADVEIIRQFDDVSAVRVDRSRLIQILVNLISNGVHAMVAVSGRPRRLTITLDRDHRRLRVRVTDVGEGIAPENIARIFSHGFTTRRGGHGFGLHSCALAARDMGGTLSAHSDGPGLGATFVLEIPIGEPAPAQ